MIDISQLRNVNASLVAIGSHPRICQSILDYDYLLGKNKPSLVAIIHSGRRYEKYFWGNNEILIPVYESSSEIPPNIANSLTYFLTLRSARRSVADSIQIIKQFPHIKGGVLFAENVPEKLSLDLFHAFEQTNTFAIGPASIGLLVPGALKLGAIGGVDYRQFIDSQLFRRGSFAVMSASGGMTNEIIRIVSDANHGLSFALSFGGDRFPAFPPYQAFLTAQNDSQTTHIAYFGELGGEDEYILADLIRSKKVTKPVIAHIVGTAASVSETPVQFGHAKALAGKKSETARAKRDALAEVGALVSETFTEFISLIQSARTTYEVLVTPDTLESRARELRDRTSRLLVTSISRDVHDEVELLGTNQVALAKDASFAEIALSLFLGKRVKSPEFISLVDYIFKLLVDNGPYVSGAVNTIISARAGKDLVSSLASGLLTIGPRFGGAVNQAAANWIAGVASGKSASEFVEEFASNKKYILGIGHKKYRAGLPDPRVKELLVFSDSLQKKEYLGFALAVERITVAKRGNLILNVDGLIAALLLDFLAEKEEYNQSDLESLVSIEFFNSFFVLPRSVGFMAHYFDQKRLDEGLFRLDSEDVSFVGLN